MTKEKEKIKKKDEVIFKRFEFIVELIGWIQIVASPLFIGLIIGYILYFRNPSLYRLILGIIITTIGLVFGIILATRKWKGKGTTFFLSRTMASPELDNLEKVTNKQNNSTEELQNGNR